MRPDIAILAAAGTGNADGKPAQGTLADFIADQVSLLQPRRCRCTASWPAALTGQAETRSQTKIRVSPGAMLRPAPRSP